MKEMILKFRGGKEFRKSSCNHKITEQEAAAYRAGTKPVKRFFEKMGNVKEFIPRVVARGPKRYADQRNGGIPGVGPSHYNDTVEGEIPDCSYQPPHPMFRPTSEHVRRSESLLCKGETALSCVDLLIRESIQVIPLELVRIDKPAIVVVRDHDTGEENRYMMTLIPIARS